MPNEGAFRHPAGDRVRQGDADQERKGRLDQIVKRAAGPVDMGLVVRQKMPEQVPRISLSHLSQPQNFGQHQEHDKTAKRIDCDVARGRLRNVSRKAIRMGAGRSKTVCNCSPPTGMN